MARAAWGTCPDVRRAGKTGRLGGGGARGRDEWAGKPGGSQDTGFVCLSFFGSNLRLRSGLFPRGPPPLLLLLPGLCLPNPRLTLSANHSPLRFPSPRGYRDWLYPGKGLGSYLALKLPLEI